MGWKGTFQGFTLGLILGGHTGSIIGCIMGDAIENSNSQGKIIEKGKQLLYSFFHCLGALTGNDSDRNHFAGELLQAWNFGDDLSQELLAEFHSCCNRTGDFSSLVQTLNRAVDAFDNVNGFDNTAIKRNVTKLFCMLIPVDNPMARQWDAMKNAGKLLGTSNIVDAFIREYYIYNRTSGVSVMPLDKSYETLGLPSSASAWKIKQAFRRKSLTLPCIRVNGIGFFFNEFVDSAERHFKHIVRAYKSICLEKRIK